MYEIRIYDEKEKHGKYRDEVYKPENDDKDADCLVLTEKTDEGRKVIDRLTELLDQYEGYTYCVRHNGEIIMGGSFDPADIDENSEIINEAC